MFPETVNPIDSDSDPLLVPLLQLSGDDPLEQDQEPRISPEQPPLQLPSPSTTPTLTTNGNRKDNLQNPIMETQIEFTLDGLSCSSCIQTVERVVKSTLVQLHTNHPAQYEQQHWTIHLKQMDTCLFPEQRLKVRYQVILSQQEQEQEIFDFRWSEFHQTIIQSIIHAVQSVGFDATFLASHIYEEEGEQYQLQDDVERGKHVRTTKNSKPFSSSSSIRDLLVGVERNGNAIVQFWKQTPVLHDKVIDIQVVHDNTLFPEEQKKKRLTEKMTKTKKKTFFDALISSAETSIQTSLCTTSTAATMPYSILKNQDMDTDRDTMDQHNPMTFKITFDQNLIGIRDVITELELLTQDYGGFGSVTVSDARSYQMKHDSIEKRRTTEMKQWRNGFLFAASFSLPVFFLSMILPHFFPIFFHRFFTCDSFLWNIRYDDLFQFIFASAVQFLPGLRFYRDAYFSIKSNSLGMSFLIASGTSAAYLYSCYVVSYNARYPTIMPYGPNDFHHCHEEEDHMNDRMMTAFETSSLLITFVYLGKFLECGAKRYACQAILQLASLTPETAIISGSLSENSGDTTMKDIHDPLSLQYTTNVWTDDDIHYFNEEKEVALALLQKNDVLHVRPGQKIPTDGIIVSGTASIDESMLTGESVPITKTIKDPVFGGTINCDGSVHILVTHLGEETTISQIIRLVETAQSCKPPIQEFADRVSRIFAPAVFAVAILTYICWCFILHSPSGSDIINNSAYYGFNSWTFPLLFSISVLVVACPCALGLAVPTAMMVGSGVGAKHGILIKNGVVLEMASNLSVVVVDKTGTVTEGRPEIEDVVLLSNRCHNLFLESTEQLHDDSYAESSEATTPLLPVQDSSGTLEEVMRLKTIENIIFLAACAEHRSEHPLAKGILAKAKLLGIGTGLKRPLVSIDNFETEVGSGIKCMVSGYSVCIGNRRGLERNKIEITEGTFQAMELVEKRGQTATVVSVNGKSEAVIGFIDKAKDDACMVMSILQHAFGIKVYMLTGDNVRTARIIAGKIGIPLENVVADVLPLEKVDFIRNLQHKSRGRIAMIGDGINDSPALAQADVGIAIGAGTEIAMETAGIVLVNSRLSDVLTAIILSKRIFTRIRTNFVWALGYNTLAIPVAGGVLYPLTDMIMPPYVAAGAMILSSLSVIISSLLLKAFRPPHFDKEYGINLRRGKVGLERVKMLSSDGSVVVQVRHVCESMESGGLCCCPAEACECFPCTLHGNPEWS